MERIERSGPGPAGADAELASVDPAGATGDRSSTASGLTIRILDEAGQPVPGADLLSAFPSDASETAELHASFMVEEIVDLVGERTVADEEGCVHFDYVARPRALLARTDRAMAIASAEIGISEVVMTLERANALSVRVVDSTGEEVPETMHVVGSVTVRPKEQRAGNPPDTYTTLRRTRGSRAVFQDPFSGIHFFAEVDGRHFTEVALAGPGLAEFAPGAMKKLHFDPQGRASRPREVELVAPPTGSIELRIVDGGGTGLGVSGLAVIETAEMSGATTGHRVRVTNGLARWDHVVLGGRRFKVRLDVPELGASWVTELNGPLAEGELSTATTSVPQGQVLTARLVDADGSPVAGAQASFTMGNVAGGHRPRGQRVASYSAPDGRVHIDLSQLQELVPPFALCVEQSIPSERSSLSLLDLTAVDLEGGHDLGDVIVDFRSETRFPVSVTGADGQPIREVWASYIEAGAPTRGFREAVGGVFEFSAFVHSGGTLAVGDNSGGHLAKLIQIKPGALPERLDVQLARGARFVASLHKGLAAGGRVWAGIELRPVLANGEKDELRRSGWCRFKGNGDVVIETLAAGRYDALITLGGRAALAQFEGVKIGASGDHSDARVDSFRFDDHLREIRLDESTSAEMPSLEVYAPLPDGSSERLVRFNAGDTFLVPTRLRCSAVFRSSRGRVVRISDVTELNDIVSLEFPAPVAAVLVVEGEFPSEGGRFELQGEPGSSAEGVRVRLSSKDLARGACPARFPRPGPYRLFVQDLPREVSDDGEMTVLALPAATTEVIQVAAPQGGTAMPRIPLRIEAPRRKGE